MSSGSKIFRRIIIELLIIFQTDYAQTATVKSGKITIFEKPANRVRTIIKNSSLLLFQDSFCHEEL